MASRAALDTLPDDVATLKAMLAEREAQLAQQQQALAQQQQAIFQHHAHLAEQHEAIDKLVRENEGLTHRLAQLLRRLYGRSSERIDVSQLLLFGQAMISPVPVDQVDASQDACDVTPKRRGHGRRPLPTDLPRHRIEHPIDPSELTCPCCGDERQRIGELVSEQLEYTPASLFVLEHVRGKYACRQCEDGGVVTAERGGEGQVIEKGLPGPGLVAHVITSKYCDHLPLYRLERIFARHSGGGVSIARSTMCSWLRDSAKLLAPLHTKMCERIRQSKVIHTDDTPLPVQDPGRGRTKTGRLWVYLGDPRNPYTIYEYTPTRQRDGPMSWLNHFTGYLQADAFGGYDGIYATGNVVEVACWAHARRKIHDARLSDPGRALHALGLIRRLYDIEKQAEERDVDERTDLRQREAVPVLNTLHAWLIEQREQVLPKSPLGQAIQYVLNHWEALIRYAADGDLAIDNNVAERAIRPLTIGRKNYLFAGSDGGGRTAAILYSLIASARRHEMDPFVYLRDVLARIGATPVSQIEQFLPDRWRATTVDDTSSHH